MLRIQPCSTGALEQRPHVDSKPLHALPENLHLEHDTMRPTLTALSRFIAWSLLLLVDMEVICSQLVAAKAIPANEFRPDNSNLSSFMQRLAGAHSNRMKSPPVFGGVMLVAVFMGKTHETGSLA